MVKVLTVSGKESTGLGAVLIAHLLKVGSATTDELVAASKAERGTVSSRLWWLCNKEGRLVCTGKGKEKSWSLPKEKPAKAAAEVKPEPKKEAVKKPAVKKVAAKKKTVKK